MYDEIGKRLFGYWKEPQMHQNLNIDIDAAIADARDKDVGSNRSATRLTVARAGLPGETHGQKCSTNSLRWPFRGSGVHVTDIDGHRYTDFVSEYSAGFHGYSSGDRRGDRACSPGRHRAGRVKCRRGA